MHYRHLLARCALGALFLGAIVGCYREVEYTEPDPPAQARAQAPAVEQTTAPPAAEEAQPVPIPANAEGASTEDAGSFGDDLAAMLADEEPPKTEEPADVTPIPETGSQSAELVGDRYSATTPAVTPAPETSIFDDPPEQSPSEPPAEPASETASNGVPRDSNTVDSILNEPVDANTPPESPVTDSMLPEQREAIAETSDPVIPNLNDDEIPTPPTVAAWNTRRAAWLLGSKMSLAALAHDFGGSAEKVQALFTQSRDLATMLNVELAQLPDKPGVAAAQNADAALNYLFAQGQKIGRELAGRLGADHAALFEVAVKSNILLVLYTPGAPTAQAIATSIDAAGGRANLPATLWQPLIDALNAKAPLADVRKAVYQLHADTDKYLDQPPPQPQ